jgi:hypothetical protein
MPHDRAPSGFERKIHSDLDNGGDGFLQEPWWRFVMAEVLTEFVDVVFARDGELYQARACGGPDHSGRWEGWVEFVNRRTGDVVRSGRETTQPNRTDTVYWSTGLTAVYLEGALERALHPASRVARVNVHAAAPLHSAPPAHESGHVPATESILNPFSVYRKGEALLRRQLSAMSAWHLVNIIRDHELSDRPSRELNATPAAVLVDVIVAAVQARTEEAFSR